ncbi:M23 family metallopeptidase [Flavobacterium salilacus subsp. salilacus]|uniref:M23 family metallopeptidase n=1 Tax=Flavobacterium TaxID=237 RepID=UPI001074E7B1|nr:MULTISPECIES: M23 family metallopeptidase [Flavobacterium]KAF2518508.1 M23 family metallopeptidase [Flavobacterium salilacus subsp. salilacus]MBE1615150.1 M23 family metallopeptidase [Flavobacterium sp. SaA2.13]
MRFRIIFLLFTVLSFAQQPYPENYFRSPLDLPLHPSGTFGEVRRNHFHTGLDYRTEQKTGFPVYAAADGYVSRIKVSSYGYGTALYIDHPNGYTTLYGHLEAYAPKIDSIVRAEQYKKQSFEIEMFFKPDEIPVTQGEVVALSGNSGGSGGPHLHFEYRDTKTEAIINPLHFGLKKLMNDTKAPAVKGLMVYALSDDAVADGSKKPHLVKLRLQKDGTYTADKILAKGKIGFSLNTSDKSTGSTGNNGIYKVKTFYNDSLNFNYTFDTFAFHEARYSNNFIDYGCYYTTGNRFQKLFITMPYPLSVIAGNTSNGQFEILPNTAQKYRIEISDFHGNKTTINGSIEYSDAPATVAEPKNVTPYFVKAASDNNYTKDGVSVYIPAHAFYEDFYMDFDVKDSILHLHHPEVPVHDYITVSFDVSHLSPEVLQKTFIEGFIGKSRNYNFSTTENGRLTAKVRSLGDYKLDQDTTPPKIYSPSFAEGKWLSQHQTFSLKISDDLSGIATFDAWLNGKWILMHYDYKTRIIFHNFSDGIADEGRNDLKVTVTDNVGNSTTFETHFFRTQNTALENNK